MKKSINGDKPSNTVVTRTAVVQQLKAGYAQLKGAATGKKKILEQV